MKIIPVAPHALASCLSVTLGATLALGATANPTIHVTANAHHQQMSFKKFLYSFPIAQPVYITGFHGAVSARNTRDSFGESLITFDVLAKGTCPKNGDVLDTYTQIRAKYPGMSRFYAAILKRSAKGEEKFPVSVSLPGGFPASHCIVAVLDGSMPGGGIFFMSADLIVNATATKPGEDLNMESLGGEYCFGMSKGCGANHGRDADQSYTAFFGFADKPRAILAIDGDSSSAAFPREFVDRYGFKVANDRWSVADDLYLVNDCRHIDRHGTEIKGFHVPPGSRKVNEVRNDRSGVDAGEVRISLTPSHLVVPAGGCLAHYAQKLGDGGVDAEYQITLWSIEQG